MSAARDSQYPAVLVGVVDLVAKQTYRRASGVSASRLHDERQSLRSFSELIVGGTGDTLRSFACNAACGGGFECAPGPLGANKGQQGGHNTLWHDGSCNTDPLVQLRVVPCQVIEEAG